MPSLNSHDKAPVLLRISIPDGRIELEADCRGYPPPQFIADPMRYFETEGRAVRHGDLVFDEFGAIEDDPAAVRDFPPWRNAQDQPLQVVCKRVNLLKSDVRRTRDPYYEYRVLHLARCLGLPTARPIARLVHRGCFFILTERVSGLRWVQRRSAGIDESRSGKIREQAEALLAQLEATALAAGLRRRWHVKDTVIQLDEAMQTVLAVVALDWERVKLDFERLARTPAAHLLREFKPPEPD